MDITEFSMRALNSEVQMIDDFNFFDQKENYDYFNQYFIQSLKIMVTINIILVILIIHE